MTKFKVGDVVRLKSGGPSMTVYTIADSEAGGLCQWFDGPKVEQAFFDFATLESAV